MYGLDKEDRRLREEVIKKLLKEFKNELLFVNVSNNEAEIVVSSKVLTKKEIRESKAERGREKIKSDVLALVQYAPALPWPPTA